MSMKVIHIKPSLNLKPGKTYTQKDVEELAKRWVEKQRKKNKKSRA